MELRQEQNSRGWVRSWEEMEDFWHEVSTWAHYHRYESTVWPLHHTQYWSKVLVSLAIFLMHMKGAGEGGSHPLSVPPQFTPGYPTLTPNPVLCEHYVCAFPFTSSNQIFHNWHVYTPEQVLVCGHPAQCFLMHKYYNKVLLIYK